MHQPTHGGTIEMPASVEVADGVVDQLYFGVYWRRLRSMVSSTSMTTHN